MVSAPVRYADTRLGIVCPVANEQATLAAFVGEVLAVCDGFAFADVKLFLIVDNASTDNTLDLARELAATTPAVCCVWAPDNRSVADAYRRGYREAIQAPCDWILEIDAGFSHRPEDIPPFFKHMAAGKDCVFSSRFARGAHFPKSALFRYLVSRGGTALVNRMLGTTLTDMTGGFECFTRRALQDILATGIHSAGPFFQTEIRYHARHSNYAEVPIRYAAPSHTIRTTAIGEALRGVWRLYKGRRGE